MSLLALFIGVLASALIGGVPAAASALIMFGIGFEAGWKHHGRRRA